MSKQHNRSRLLPSWIMYIGIVAIVLIVIGLYEYGRILPPPQSKAPGVSRPPRSEVARAMIERIERTEEFRLGIAPDLSMELDTAGMQPRDFIEACIELLERGSTEEKEKAARFLGRLAKKLGDPFTPIEPLSRALLDPHDSVRARACYALQWLDAGESEPIKSKLAQLCRADPAIAVRVAAAVALETAGGDDASAAFEAGLESEKKALWEVCEDCLERVGKLKLPLPKHIYREITPEKYEQMMADSRWYSFRRETKVDSTIYLEFIERAHHVPLHRQWARVTLESKEE